MTVPVGLSPPVTVAWSAMDEPTMGPAGCWVVAIVGVAGMTDSDSLPEALTGLLNLSPL